MIHRVAIVVAVAACGLDLAGCRTPVVLLSRVVVMNQSDEAISNVTVMHLPTRKQGNVSEILPGRDLVVEMEPTPMRATSAQVSWTDSQGPHRVDLELPSGSSQESSGTLVYSIAPLGRVVVFLSE